jgi:hypothetical protein
MILMKEYFIYLLTEHRVQFLIKNLKEKLEDIDEKVFDLYISIKIESV